MGFLCFTIVYFSPQVLAIEHECKSLEMKILKSDEEAAQFDEESRELETILQQAAEDTLAAAEAHVTSVSDGSNVGDSSQRYQAPKRPSKSYMFWRSGGNISDLVVV